jgi:hyaluronan synthase
MRPKRQPLAARTHIRDDAPSRSSGALPDEDQTGIAGDDPGTSARERAELTARGSHMRRVRRRSPRARGATAPSIAGRPRFTAAMLAWRALLASAVLVVFAVVLAQGAAAVLLAPGGSSLLTVFLTLFGLVAVGYFGLTVWHALRYREVAPFSDSALPRVTVIVPAYNEGLAVRVALESALASDYPAHELEILAIDDGSTDDTWEHIEAVAAAHPGRVVTIRQPRNGGKREALRTGFERATGELVVTVDSDSKLDPGALRAIVAPMLADPEVAAVAGRVLVLNREDNLLTRLVSARFFITFDLARAAQSRFGAVLCTPGALSAYRMDAVRAVLERWSTQTFLGQPCTIAEDRALTTWLLREGYRSVYQRSAVVETLMPTTLPRMACMLVRWERGNIREDLVMLPVLASRWRPRDQWWPTMEIALELLQVPAAWLGLGLVAVRLAAEPGALPVVGAIVVLGALVQTLYTLRSARAADFVYGVGYALFALLALQWVFPYSLLTVRDGRWLTR